MPILQMFLMIISNTVFFYMVLELHCFQLGAWFVFFQFLIVLDIVNHPAYSVRDILYNR